MLIDSEKLRSEMMSSGSGVVTKDISSNSVAVGVPARVIESVDDYYKKIKNKVVYTKNMSTDKKGEYLKKMLSK